MHIKSLTVISQRIILCFIFIIAAGTSCATFLAFNQGEEFFNQGDYASADKFFSQVIDDKSANIYELQQAYLLRGETRLKLGNDQNALDDINAAEDILSSIKGLYLRGRAKQKLGAFNGAISDFNRIIQTYSKEARQLHKSQMDINNRHVPWAKANTAELAGKSSIALGEIYLYQEDYAAAIAHFNSATLIIPTDPEVFQKRSGAYQLIEKEALATKDFQQFLTLGGDPKSKPELVMGPLLLKNALAQYSAEHYSVALDLANRALILYPNYVGALMCRGHSYAKLGKHSIAIKDFSSVIAKEPKNTEAHIYRAYSFNELGKYDAAKQDTTYVLSRSTNNIHALFHRGFSYLGKKDYENAATDFSQVIEIDPSHKRSLIYRGIVRYQLKNLKGAIVDFQTLIKLAPSHRRAHYLLALSQYQAHLHKAAMITLVKAIKLAPNNSKLYHMRGRIYFSRNKKKSALADFEKAITLDPKNGKLYLSRGIAKSSLGQSATKDYALAQKLFKQQKQKTNSKEAFEPKMEPLSKNIETIL